MEISNNLQAYFDSPNKDNFTASLMLNLIDDARERNPDVSKEKMLKQLARPKYDEAIKALNAELESLKIINRRKNDN